MQVGPVAISPNEMLTISGHLIPCQPSSVLKSEKMDLTVEGFEQDEKSNDGPFPAEPLSPIWVGPCP